jgi:glutathione S-transferase
MPDKAKLFTCHLRDEKPLLHPCGKASKALEKNGHDFDLVEYGQGKPFGRGTEGTRPDLLELSGQEKLPVLSLPDGTTVSGSKDIVKWAKANPPTASAALPSTTPGAGPV